MNNTDETSLPCHDKLAFDTVEAARATAVVSKWRRGSRLKIYTCRYCHLYHLSSNSPD